MIEDQYMMGKHVHVAFAEIQILIWAAKKITVIVQYMTHVITKLFKNEQV